jgi:hypothetical protein
LLLLGQSPSDEEIVYEARENWHEEKLKIERGALFQGAGVDAPEGLGSRGKGEICGKEEIMCLD